MLLLESSEILELSQRWRKPLINFNVSCVKPLSSVLLEMLSLTNITLLNIPKTLMRTVSLNPRNKLKEATSKKSMRRRLRSLTLLATNGCAISLEMSCVMMVTDRPRPTNTPY